MKDPLQEQDDASTPLTEEEREEPITSLSAPMCASALPRR